MDCSIFGFVAATQSLDAVVCVAKGLSLVCEIVTCGVDVDASETVCIVPVIVLYRVCRLRGFGLCFKREILTADG